MENKTLHQSFIDALPDRFEGLERAFESWQQSGTPALDEFYRLAHNLAGAGALYGFEQVGDSCRELERYLRNLKSENVTADAEIVEKVQMMLAEINKSIKQATCEAEF